MMLHELRAQWEDVLLHLEGVVGVGQGVGEDAQPQLKVYTSVPVEVVRPKLAKELQDAPIELIYIGKPRAQPSVKREE